MDTIPQITALDKFEDGLKTKREDSHGVFKPPICLGYLVGMCIGAAVTVIIFLSLKDWCNATSETLSSNILTTDLENTVDLLREIDEFKTTLPPRPDHEGNHEGICCNPPDPPENAECVYGRSLNNIYARYTAKTTKDVESFDHCPVSVCKENNAWSAFNITLSSADCYSINNYDTGINYHGKIFCTNTGRRCQRWDTDHPHTRNPVHIPVNSEDLHSNYCRDPGPPYEYMPWCYTEDPMVRWEFCHVPTCPSVTT